MPRSLSKQLRHRQNVRRLRSLRQSLQMESLEARMLLTAYADAVLADNPLAFFQFDEGSGTTANDSTANATHGNIENATYSLNGGGRGGDAGNYALSFDGNGDSVRVVDDATSVNTNAFNSITANNKVTVEFWQYGIGQARDDTIFGGFDSSGNRQVMSHLPWGNSNVYFDTGGGASTPSQRINTAMPATTFNGRWNHWVFIKDGNNKTVYNNGVAIPALTQSNATANIGDIHRFFVGSEANSSGGITNSYLGLIDDFAVYDKALSAAQVADHYQASFDDAFATDEDTAISVDSSVGLLTNDMPLYRFENVALSSAGGVASQSTDRVGSGCNVASCAIDGDTNGSFGGNSVTHTLNETQPWWQVQLPAMRDINSINLFNRTDCCSNRLDNFRVSIWQGDPNSGGVEQFGRDFSFPGGPGTSLSLDVPNFVKGNYVRVQLANDGESEPLSLAEVQVFAAAHEVASAQGMSLGGSTTARGDGSVTVTTDKGGSLTITDDGGFDYDPSVSSTLNTLPAGATDTDTFTYTYTDGTSSRTATVTLTITGVNDAPNAVDDPNGGLPNAAYTTTEDAVLNVPDGPDDVLANDTDPDTGDSINLVTFDSTSVNGAAVVVNPDGSFSYDPSGSATIQTLDQGQPLTDTFTYTITDSLVPANGRFIRVRNNGPVDRLLHIGEIEAFAPGVTPAANFDGTNDLALSSKGATVESTVGGGGHGNPNATIDGSEQTGGSTWTKQAVGTEIVIDLGGSFDIERVRVHQRNDSCCQDRLMDFTVSLLADDGSGNPGAVVQSASYPGQPPTNSFGEVALDPVPSGALQVATVSIAVNGVNDTPNPADDVNDITELSDDTVTVNTVSGDLFSNDTDVDDPASSFSLVQVNADTSGNTVGLYGTLTWSPNTNGDGTYTYALDDSNAAVQALAPGQTLTDTFTYTLSDNHSDGSGSNNPLTNTANLVITIKGANDSPNAEDDAADVIEDTMVTTAGNVISDAPADSDVDNSSSGFAVTDVDGNAVSTNTNIVGSHGTLTISSDGSYSYALDNAAAQPLAEGQTVTDSFVYTLDDNATGPTVARFVQVIEATPSTFHLSELEVFEAGVTPDNTGGATFGGLTTSSNDIAGGVPYSIGNVYPAVGTTSMIQHGNVNNQTNNVLENGGAVWSTNVSGQNPQFTLDLGSEYAIDRVRAWPRADTCCPERWDALTINFYADDGTGSPGTLVSSVSIADPNANTPHDVSVPAVPVPLTDTATLTVTVTGSNDDPVVDAGGDQSVNEGATVNLDPATFTDVDTNDTHTATIDWGDGSLLDTGVVEPTLHTVSGSHVYADDGTYTATVCVDDGTASVCDTFSVTVNNVDPSVTVSDRTTSEGAALNITGLATFTDPGFDNAANPNSQPPLHVESFTYSLDWGDGSALESGSVTMVTPGSAGTPTSGSINGSHVYADSGVYDATVTITDDDGGSTTETFGVTVNNVAPTGTISGPGDASPSEELTFTFEGHDISPADELILDCNVNWGDGSMDSLGNCTTPVTRTHEYGTLGSFSVVLSITDDTETTNVTHTVSVTNNPRIDANGNLLVPDSLEGSNDILIYKSSRGGHLVKRNATTYGPFFPTTGTTVVITGDYPDRITIVSDTLCGNVDAGGGDNIFNGSGCDDTFVATDGRNVVIAGAGNDTITVGNGDNDIDAGAGDDVVTTGSGNDEIIGRDGNDVLNGGGGNDDISGERGDDIIRGGDGNDTLSGGEGNDIVLGEAGQDRVFGRQGNDILFGGLGADDVQGNNDDDIVVGGGVTLDNVALGHIRSEWTSNNLASTRLSNILIGAGLTMGNALNSTTVTADGVGGGCGVGSYLYVVEDRL